MTSFPRIFLVVFSKVQQLIAYRSSSVVLKTLMTSIMLLLPVSLLAQSNGAKVVVVEAPQWAQEGVAMIHNYTGDKVVGVHAEYEDYGKGPQKASMLVFVVTAPCALGTFGQLSPPLMVIFHIALLHYQTPLCVLELLYKPYMSFVTLKYNQGGAASLSYTLHQQCSFHGLPPVFHNQRHFDLLVETGRSAWYPQVYGRDFSRPSRSPGGHWMVGVVGD